MSVPKSNILVFDQDISAEEGFYRVRAGFRIHYLTIKAGVYDEDVMCRPYLLIPRLPDFPDSDWTTLDISPREDGNVSMVFSSNPLPTIDDDTVWHANKVEVLDLEIKRDLKPRTSEVMYNGAPAIAKIARFSWELRNVEDETFAYSILHQHAARYIPNFLGHLTENGRVMGFLLEKLDGSFASVGDVAKCEEALQAVHRAGWIHGDVNRYNFVVNRETGDVKVIDFEHVDGYRQDAAREELQSLRLRLQDESVRGRPMSPITRQSIQDT